MQKNILAVSKCFIQTFFNTMYQNSALQYCEGPGISISRLLRTTWQEYRCNSMKPEQLHRVIRKQSDIVILDIRTSQSYTQGHIVNSVNIPMKELVRADRFSFSKNASIIVVCYFGVTSREAIRILAEKGYRNLTNLSGGMGTWSYEREHSIEAS